MTTVAFQGVPGAYSDEAAQALFPGSGTAGYPTFVRAFDALACGAVDVAVLPVENTVAGVVQEVSDLLWTHETVQVTGEHVSPIRHVLMTKGDAPVKRALSHPQALAQCAAWLRSNGIEPVVFYDTAGAAEEVARSGTRGDGAIASRSAAERYGLKIVATDIADSDTNQTRFLVLTGRSENALASGAGRRKLILGFTTDHRPGALAEVMAVFADHDANLTRLDSRPVPHMPFRYRFYADAEAAASSEPSLLDALRGAALEVRAFGSFDIEN
ncbi:MAG TPA: prephenate dehydratase domain-containing protein [Chloroflexota bacterium]|nr:prephenate dehydratase domain-containing protein [Chloroflexota bacterium]